MNTSELWHRQCVAPSPLDKIITPRAAGRFPGPAAHAPSSACELARRSRRLRDPDRSCTCRIAWITKLSTVTPGPPPPGLAMVRLLTRRASPKTLKQDTVACKQHDAYNVVNYTRPCSGERMPGPSVAAGRPAQRDRDRFVRSCLSWRRTRLFTRHRATGDKCCLDDNKACDALHRKLVLVFIIPRDG